MTFVDAHAMNRQHPDTFHLPDPDAVSALEPGDFVKLGFRTGYDDPSVERMWVKLTSVQPWAGELANQPAFIETLSLGDLVRGFEAKHFFAVLKGET